MDPKDLLPDFSFSDEPAPLDEAELLAISAADATKRTADLPLSTRFTLRSAITPIQGSFLDKNGFIVFARVASEHEVRRVLSEIQGVEQKLINEGITSIYGVPIWLGSGPDGEPFLHRMGFSSLYSDWLDNFVQDPRFEPVRTLIGAQARIGTREKDGVVFNRYMNLPGGLRKDLAWHTDALRDVFYNWKMPGPMLNVGLHFDRIRPTDGGLRLLPGTHKQNTWSTLFSKIHFLTNDDDPREIMVETWPGDLSVHDGRMWHRVKSSPLIGPKSLRRSMYVPYIVDAYQPKDKNSKTKLYMRLFNAIMKTKGALSKRRRRRIQG